MNQYIRTSLGVAFIIIMASTIGFFSWKYYQNNLIDAPVTVQSPIKKSEKPMACTEEAKLCPDGVNSVGRTEANCEFAECPEIVGIADKLVIDSPAPGEIISSPISVSGRARGTWFFEGSFPVEVYDGDNKLLGSFPINFTPKSDQDTWMTTEFVDFKGEIKFTQPKTSEGYLLFKKDNPSGKPEMDEFFKMPVKFNRIVYTADWQKYTDADHGFEFKYIKNDNSFVSADGRSSGPIFSVGLDGVEAVYGKFQHQKTMVGIDCPNNFKNIGSITIDGIYANKCLDMSDTAGPAWTTVVQKKIQTGVDVYTISCSNERSDFEDYCEKLLATFKFTK